MGAGAGYTISVENCEINDIKSFSLYSLDDTVLTISCEANGVGTVQGDSYYFSSGPIEGVNMLLTYISMDIADIFGEHVDEDAFTESAKERLLKYFTEEWDPDMESLNELYWDDDFLSQITVKDLDDEYFRSWFSSGFSISGVTEMIGAGWSHATFSGKQFDIVDNYNTFTLTIPDKYIVDFIDLAIQGENTVYEAIYNGDILDTYSDEDEAIAALKQEINEAIADDGPEAVDFAECYVECGYEYIVNGEGESDVDFDNAQLCYNADADDDYEQYL